MSKTKFREVMDLIGAIFDLIAELIPLGRDGIALVVRATATIKEFKERLNDDEDALPSAED